MITPAEDPHGQLAALARSTSDAWMRRAIELGAKADRRAAWLAFSVVVNLLLLAVIVA